MAAAEEDVSAAAGTVPRKEPPRWSIAVSLAAAVVGDAAVEVNSVAAAEVKGAAAMAANTVADVAAEIGGGVGAGTGGGS